MPLLEIAVTSLEDALRAEEGGADSVEVSRDLSVGGLTPGMELVQSIRAKLKIKVNVLLRPHARNFEYSNSELIALAKTLAAAIHVKADGVVFGARDERGMLNLGAIQAVMMAARSIPLTVHRAIDESVYPEDALVDLAEMGIARVLTAGPARTAFEGRKRLAKWVEKFGSKISFVASGGLTMEQIPTMLSEVKAHEYHFGSAARTDGVVDVAKVRELRAAIGR
ncbi:MAG TPA: copper homeostasis protein CutC [Planctomycetota bacterium]|nr:copper homeostasis protein CutC [Planctomycetota bacterium]